MPDRFESALRATRVAVLTLLVGGVGAAVFRALGFPAPFLAGPAVTVTTAILLGVRLAIPVPLGNACFLLLGIGIGSTVTPEVLQAAVTWPVSFVVMTMTLLTSLVANRTLLHRAFGFDPFSAMLAATPGHLSYVMGLSTELGSDVSRIAIVQSMRVLFLTVLVPALLALWGVEGDAVTTPTAPMTPLSALMLAAVSVAAAWGLARLNVPAAWLLGGMFVSGAAHATELAPGQLPSWLTLAAFTVMGSLIGTRFRGQSLVELRRNLLAGIGVTLVSCGVAAIGALMVARILDLSPALLLISFAPGGVEVMAAMSVQIGVEPTFVAAHHVFRLLILTAIIPLLFFRGRNRP
ncbi:hypothetical protein SAMN04490244_11387 [Tranquillimonas rosea]|uniref:Ammonia monooxygenase n=1 Tax=Tranquillimonas rosea TaxID=641238 RepID=A0A1H9WWK4_9RHOB|nr:AbrB family transcriptional regulator [Tranquillimonas rosea]SES37793.1 hypothetical protein SAMN04490244_11387 [Tranquillimonas rosea]